MRLIDTQTGKFVEFFDLEKIPPYAILSHTWDPAPTGEQSYQDVVKIQEKYNLLVREQCCLVASRLKPQMPISVRLG